MRKSLFIVLIALSHSLTAFSQAQPDIYQNVSKAYTDADKRLNEVYQQILEKHKENAVFIKNIRNAQRFWIKYRDAQFEVNFPESNGQYNRNKLTTAQADYLAKLTDERTKILREILDQTLVGLIGAPTFARGGTITYSGGKTIHTFTSSGTFYCINGGRVEILVVAGGGGGGCHTGGGGGGGGIVYRKDYYVSGTIPVIVGDGGRGSSNNSIPGSNGFNSVFSSLSATGGGGGGSRFTDAGSGGSGGGGSPKDLGNSNGSGTSGQGYAGGVGGNAWNYLAGGGGGAGAIGSGGTGSGENGNGGAGLVFSISGTYVFYGGGGGGGVYGTDMPGTGGLGGGGAGSNSNSIAGNGTPNTGGGGGGGGLISGTYVSLPGGNGGSGIVIICYPTK